MIVLLILLELEPGRLRMRGERVRAMHKMENVVAMTLSGVAEVLLVLHRKAVRAALAQEPRS